MKPRAWTPQEGPRGQFSAKLNRWVSFAELKAAAVAHLAKKDSKPAWLRAAHSLIGNEAYHLANNPAELERVLRAKTAKSDAPVLVVALAGLHAPRSKAARATAPVDLDSLL